MNQILYSKKSNQRPILIIIALVAVIVVLVVCFGFGIANKFNDKILNGVTVANVDVSGKTKEEAVDAINEHYNNSNQVRSLILSITVKNIKAKVLTSEIGFGYTDAEQLAQEAYNYGRDENIISNNFTVLGSYFSKEKVIDTEINIDRTKLENKINSLLSGDRSFSQDDYYEISGDTLVIGKGTEGRKVNFDKLEEEILTALNEDKSQVEIPVIVSKAQELDFEKMYSTVHKDPVNASYKEGKDFEIIKEQEGIDFDLEEAKTKYAELEAGDTALVQLVITQPEIKVSDLGDKLFENVIATYSSQYDKSNADRETNLKIAAEKCNGKILYPGEEFSFNTQLGNRTTENGYKESDSFGNGEIVQTVGGGICQVSSTLYNAVLRADMEVTARTAHSMFVKYVPQSTDATVVDNSIDFKFKNNYDYPIKVGTTCENGVCTATLYGYKGNEEGITIDIETKIIDTVPYAKKTIEDSTLAKGKTVVVQSPTEGYVSEAYKVFMKDGKEISRKLISKDSYDPIEEIVRIGTKETSSGGTSGGNTSGGETAYNHKYVASSNWSSDATYHWHPCAYFGCKMNHTSSKAYHTYGIWVSNGSSTHIRTCQCGRKEEVAHNFGGWVRAGENKQTRTCADCKYVEVKVYSTNPNLPAGWDNPENPYASEGQNGGSTGTVPQGWDNPVSGY